MKHSWKLVAVLVAGELATWNIVDATAQFNCSANTRGLSRANGSCPKGCLRNTEGSCEPENCTTDWLGWLSRPVTMSCYFHWFLLIFAAFVLSFMVGLMTCNLLYELQLCLRKRRVRRYRRFSFTSSGSSVA